MLCIILLSSCNQEDQHTPDPCLPYVSNPLWAEEIFHQGTIIQFPDNYMGGRSEIQGPRFIKYRSDTLAHMDYGFCGPFDHCDEYGDILTNPDTTFVKVLSLSFQLDNITLTDRLEFCDNLVTTGIYFYKDSIIGLGKLYCYTDNAFKEAMTLEYDLGVKAEIEQILQTIHK